MTNRMQVARHMALPKAIRRSMAESSPGHTRRLQFLQLDQLLPTPVTSSYVCACVFVCACSCRCVCVCVCVLVVVVCVYVYVCVCVWMGVLVHAYAAIGIGRTRSQVACAQAEPLGVARRHPGLPDCVRYSCARCLLQ